jgi:hypothetical protein
MMSQPGGSNSLSIRVENRSPVDFDEVRVSFPDETMHYGTVKRGATSKYRAVRRAYRYAEVVAVAADRQFVLQPIDFVGETELSDGKYTYVLNVAGDRLTLRLEKDE